MEVTWLPGGLPGAVLTACILVYISAGLANAMAMALALALAWGPHDQGCIPGRRNWELDVLYARHFLLEGPGCTIYTTTSTLPLLLPLLSSVTHHREYPVAIHLGINSAEVNLI